MADNYGIGGKKLEAPKPAEKKPFFNYGKAEAATPPPPGTVGDVKGTVNSIKKRNAALKEAMGE